MKKRMLISYLLFVAAITINAQPESPMATGIDSRQSCTIIHASDGQ